MQYCAILNKLYPPRCCDDNPEITHQLPSPILVRHTRTRTSHCSVCGYNNGNESEHENIDDNTLTTTTIKNANCSNGDHHYHQHLSQQQQQQPPPPPPLRIKITSQVVDRSLRPFLGMFFQQPGAKPFRRACHVASRDLRIRNCGPAFILQRAVVESGLSSSVLDEPIGLYY
jgi:hypothetical protein